MNPFEGYRVTSPYGWRTHPVYGDRRFHTGIDLVKEHRAPIHAFLGGVVMFAGWGATGSGFGNYGYVVAILDARERLHCYCHLDSISVQVGDRVKRGQEIGRQGNTGVGTGSHLHYEVRKRYAPSYGWVANAEDRAFEPTKYLVDWYRKEQEAMELESLLQKIEALDKRIETLEHQLERVQAPQWFVNEFGSADLGGLIHEPAFTPEGWRVLAIGLRARKGGDGNA